MPQNGLRASITQEARRLEDDALYSFKGHFEACARWSCVHLWLGGSASLASAIAGAVVLTKAPSPWGDLIPGILALIAGAVVAVSTFLNPKERADAHQRAGSQYQALRNAVRLLYEIKANTSSSDDLLVKELEELRAQQSTLSEELPLIPRWAYEKARKGIREGETAYDFRNNKR